MGAQSQTEEVLRKIHVLFAKAEPYENSSRRVIVDKNDLMDLLKELNSCMYSMMDEYELTQSSRDKATREQKKRGDDILFDARKEADDIYAAAMMYTDRALKNIQDSMLDASQKLESLMESTKETMEEQRSKVQSDQLEARARLQDMVDSDKYMRLIQDENIRLEKEKDQTTINSSALDDGPDYSAIKPEIHINEAYLQRTGMNVPGEDEESKDHSDEKVDDITLPEIELPADLKMDLNLDDSSLDIDKKEKDEKKSFRIGSIFGKD